MLVGSAESERRGYTGMRWMFRKSLGSVAATGRTFLSTFLYLRMRWMESSDYGSGSGQGVRVLLEREGDRGN